MKITDIKGTVKLANGVQMPYLGLGVFKSREGSEVINAVKWALEAGYRHIDTAAFYDNEEGVSEGIRQSSLKREEIFITSKVWNSDQGYEKTLKAFDKSLKRMKTDYLDLYLIHWPVKNKYKETWRALEKIYNEKRVKAIGVSNFLAHHLDDLIKDSEIAPMVNQIEFHPNLVQPQLIKKCLDLNIRPEAWSPLMQGGIFEINELQRIANRYDKNVAQLVLRWNLQKGIITIPKSVNKIRIESNSNIFDFEISNEDILEIEKLDSNRRIGPDPDNIDF